MSLPFAIPGYSFDPTTKKYFPSASSSRSTSTSGPASGSRAATSGQAAQTKRRKDQLQQRPSKKGKERARHPQPVNIFDTVRALSYTGGGPQFRRQALRSSLLASRASNISYLPLQSTSSFVTSLAYGDGLVLAGDSAGWLYSMRPDEEEATSRGWNVELSLLNSPITSIEVCGTSFIATSFGPSPKLLFGPLDFASSPIVIVSPRQTTDVWSSLLLKNGSVALGCDSQLLLSKSPMYAPSFTSHKTEGSSVLAMCSLEGDLQAEGTFLAGLRSRKIKLFDVRAGGGQTGYDVIRCASPVVGLEHLGGRQVVAAGMNGDLNIYDLRFLTRGETSGSPAPPSSKTSLHPSTTASSSSLRRVAPSKAPPLPAAPESSVTAPLASLPGHNNSYTTGLALLHLPRSRTILAAGQDEVVRAWSALDGSPISELSSPGGLWAGRAFAGGVKGMVSLEGATDRVGLVAGHRWEIFRSNG